MIAVQRHQNGGAAGQANHAPLQIVDQHPVIGAEGLAQAQHQAGDVVLDGVAHGETQRDADHARTAQHRPQKRARPDHVERDDETADDEDETDRARDQFREEGVGRDAVPKARQPGDEIPHRSDDESDDDRQSEKREQRDEMIDPVLKAGEAARAVHGKIALDRVFDSNDAGNTPDDGFGARDILLRGYGARQRDDALLHVDTDIFKGGQFAENAANAIGDARIAARFLRIVDDLFGRRARRRFGRFRSGGQHGRGREAGEGGGQNDQQGGEAMFHLQHSHDPATVMPSTLRVGTSSARRRSRSLAGVRVLNMASRLPATVISATGPAIWPFTIRKPDAPRL